MSQQARVYAVFFKKVNCYVFPDILRYFVFAFGKCLPSCSLFYVYLVIFSHIESIHNVYLICPSGDYI